VKPTLSTMLVPVPKASAATPGAGPGSAQPSSGSGTSATISFGAPPLRDRELLAWCETLIESVLGGLPPGPASPAGDGG
jgi:hypothetical protein